MAAAQFSAAGRRKAPLGAAFRLKLRHFDVFLSFSLRLARSEISEMAVSGG